MTDPGRTRDLPALVARLPRGFGVIYRHFGATGREQAAFELAAACRRSGLVLLIAADPKLAMAVGADGVHWPLGRLRRVRPAHPGFIETASAHSRADVARARSLGVDAAFLSSVFASRSISARPGMGALRFRRMVRGAGLPVYALGGIHASNAALAMAGAAGWAGVDAVLEGWS